MNFGSSRRRHRRDSISSSRVRVRLGLGLGLGWRLDPHPNLAVLRVLLCREQLVLLGHQPDPLEGQRPQVGHVGELAQPRLDQALPRLEHPRVPGVRVRVGVRVGVGVRGRVRVRVT